MINQQEQLLIKRNAELEKELVLKNRELEIQISLEKIREMTMAMQRSEEIKEVSPALLRQMQNLGITSAVCFTGIMNEPNGSMELSLANDQTQNHAIFIAGLDDHPVVRQMYDAWKAGNKSLIIDLEGEELASYSRYLRQLGIQFIPGIRSERRIYSMANFSKGTMGVVSDDFLPGESIHLLERFAIAFDGTYTRFLDLEKAEDQTREAQIEAALERVRSRSMAMHHSKELHEVAEVLFRQMLKFGGNLLNAGIVLCKTDADEDEYWISSDSGIRPVISIPHTVDPVQKKLYEGWKNKLDFYSESRGGDELKAHYSYMASVPALKPYFDEDAPSNRSFPTWQKWHAAYFSQGYLFMLTAEEYDEEKILVRFAKIFDQAYTRFLDLKKAEEQAREAQIEAALEKVRSRSLAMYKSDEIIEVVRAVFEKLIELNIELNTAFIIIFKESSRDTEWWLINRDEGEYSKIFVPFVDVLIMKNIFEIKEQGEELFSATYHAEEKNELFRYLFSQTDFKYAPPDRQKFIFESEAISISMAMTNKIAIQITRHHEKSFSGGDNEIVKRFAKVFDQSYTRFLDLQKAEAQTLRAEQDLIEIKAARKKAEEALTELKATQTQLIQSEKMASLGELTAGIAHEIQNPLNFVNNFSELSNELIAEMVEEADKGNTNEVKAIAEDIKQNLEKINHHGKRADAIVKGMLQHSQSSKGVQEPTDINALADEYLRLAYHGLRAKDNSLPIGQARFNATLKTDFDNSIGKIPVIPQDMGRVLLNVYTNAFYAINEKRKSTGSTFRPTISVATKKSGNQVFIYINDNGNGIPQTIIDKIFQPFFTTKPTGQGTGLGLSLSYDIVKAHGGEIKVVTKRKEGLPGEASAETGTEFIIQLPL